MKRLLVILTCSTMLGAGAGAQEKSASAPVPAAAPAVTPAPPPATTTITDILGKVYQDSKITRADPDGLVITHRSGVSKIPFRNLPPEYATRFSYDPARGDQYAAEQRRAQWLFDQKQDALRTQQKQAETAAAEAERQRFVPVNGEQIKAAWLAKLAEEPPRLSGDYHPTMRRNAALAASIRAGNMDGEANATAAQMNADALLARGRGAEAQTYADAAASERDRANQARIAAADRQQRAQEAQMQAAIAEDASRQQEEQLKALRAINLSTQNLGRSVDSNTRGINELKTTIRGLTY